MRECNSADFVLASEPTALGADGDFSFKAFSRCNQFVFESRVTENVDNSAVFLCEGPRKTFGKVSMVGKL